MTDHLRSIAVTVDEPDPGVFHWVLIESTEDASVYQELEASEGSYDSWTHALRQGTERLMALAKESPMAGPRASGEDEDADPVRGAAVSP
ncbi:MULTISPECIES: hypothetical protein [unclassified Variovorax]|uniref:hypothetical protein n=1 Tax=unclassified Variovorax TaxID=663243 RepID=UPI000837B88B|nr:MULTISPECIES: hypothetical protein [unclassified Variovorax]PNG49202.1 hypothetical protein CHC06_06439 [Variovorax sp. B2]PNG49587.1 hypothetical protein CHC07_06496 [Variovorax sp. B4]VTV18748.1 hypothetical protein WDL1P2_00401 [Variovorax sp. WDL1]